MNRYSLDAFLHFFSEAFVGVGSPKRVISSMGRSDNF